MTQIWWERIYLDIDVFISLRHCLLNIFIIYLKSKHEWGKGVRGLDYRSSLWQEQLFVNIRSWKVNWMNTHVQWRGYEEAEITVSFWLDYCSLTVFGSFLLL